MKKRHFPIGLRTFKTGLSVIVSMVVVSLFGDPSIFPALASIAVMSRTFDEGLNECRNQFIGITLGGFLGCATVYVWPEPPIWFIGIGVMAVIFICTSLRITFSLSLSAAIFIVACTSPADLVVDNTIRRLLHTSIGLLTGLIINYTIVPYDNSPKIYALMREYAQLLPQYLKERFLLGHYPVLDELHQLMDSLKNELSIYRHQRFRKRTIHQNEFMYLSGCAQLAERSIQELSALCCMDALGYPDEENLRRLRGLGIEMPDTVTPFCTEVWIDVAVTNYHLKNLLDSRDFLLQLLEQRSKDASST